MTAPAGEHPARIRLADWLLLAGLVLLWGSAFSMTKTAVASAPPLLIVAGRLWIGALLLWGWCVVRGFALPRLWPKPDRLWLWFVVLGFVGNAAPFLLITTAQRIVPSALAGVLMATTPLFTVALAHFFVAGEAMTPRKLAGFALGFAGVAILIGPSALTGFGGAATLAQLAILLGSFAYSANTIIARRSPPCHTGVAAAGMLMTGAVMMTPFGVYAALAAPTPEPAAWAAIAWLGFGPTGLAAIFYFALVRSAGPSFLSLTNYLVPVTALLIGVAVMAERLRPSVFIAVVVILAGLALGATRARPRI